MKSLGKQNVVIESYVNGSFVAATPTSLTVYEKADGSLWINNMGAKRQINRQADGEFRFAAHITEVKRESFADFLGKVGGVVPDSHS